MHCSSKRIAKKKYIQSKTGFFLTEILLFFFLFSLFSVLVMQFIASSGLVIMSVAKKSDQIAMLMTATDWLIRDIQLIDTRSTQIVLEDYNCLKISNACERITWKQEDATLIRIVQRYDAQEKRWKKSHTSLVAQQIMQVLFRLLYSNSGDTKKMLKGIACELEGSVSITQTERVVQTVALRNGVI